MVQSGSSTLALRLALLLALAAGLTACAGLPSQHAPPPPSTTLRAADSSPLGRLAFEAGVPAGRSGFRPLLLSAVAWQSRLTLISQALVAAAARGVRVRLLLEDFYTTGLTDLLLGLAAHPDVELRLHNPFPAGRDSRLLRLASLLGDFAQLNRRMHNKLFIADGRAAIVGGRNLADAYFMRSENGNFLDFDLLRAGAVVGSLAGHFDTFWNSRFAVPLQALANNGLTPAQRRASFEVLTRARRPAMQSTTAASAQTSTQADAITALANLPLVVADAQVFFDSPEKTAKPSSAKSAAGSAAQSADGGPLLLPITRLLDQATERVTIVWP